MSCIYLSKNSNLAAWVQSKQCVLMVTKECGMVYLVIFGLPNQSVARVPFHKKKLCFNRLRPLATDHDPR